MKKFLFSLLMSLLVAGAIAQVEDHLLLVGEMPIGPMKSPTSIIAVQSDGQVAISFVYNIGFVDISVKDAQENVVSHEVVDTGLTPTVVINTSSWPSGDYVLVIIWDKNKRITGEFTL